MFAEAELVFAEVELVFAEVEPVLNVCYFLFSIFLFPPNQKPW